MKLLVSDFDGTYYKSEEGILRNNEKIQEFRKNGNLFMLSSGRSFVSLKKMKEKYNLEYDYLSCCDGSILYDKENRLIVKYDLNEQILKEFLKLKRLAKVERIQYSYPDDYYPKYKEDSLIGCNLVIQNKDITKKFIDNFYLLQKENTEFDFLSYKHEEVTFFCLKNKGINKSSTIYYLMNYLNLKKENIYTIGDNENDYEMLKNFKGYYIKEAEVKIEKVCLKGFDEVYELILEIEKNG